MKALFFGFLTLLAIGISGAVARSAVGAAPALSGTITLYTSESEDDVNFLAQDFMRRTPGTGVRIFRAGAGPVEAKLDAEMQAALHDAGDEFHEVRLIFNVVGFNTAQVRFPPSSWWDLTLPRYRGRAGMPSPFISGAAFAQVGTFAALPEFGWSFYQKLAQNKALVYPSNGDVIEKLASGEISVGLVVDFFVRAAKKEGSPVDYTVPKE